MLGLEMFISVHRNRISILFQSNYIVYMHKPSYTKQPKNRKPKRCNVFLQKTAFMFILVFFDFQRHVSVIVNGESPEIQLDSSGLHHCPFCRYKGSKCDIDHHIKCHASVKYRGTFSYFFMIIIYIIIVIIYLYVCNVCRLLTKVCRGAFRKQEEKTGGKKSYRYVSYTVMCDVVLEQL